MVWSHNQNLATYLIVEMNSGRMALFSSEDESFLVQAKDSLISSFNSQNMHMVINFKECYVEGNNFGTDGTINNF